MEFDTAYNQLLLYTCLGLSFHWAKNCYKDVSSYTFQLLSISCLGTALHKSVQSKGQNARLRFCSFQILRIQQEIEIQNEWSLTG